jgi:hypothetical protein
MRQLLHVGFAFRDAPRPEELEPIFDEADDWIRYAPNCWILWTSVSPKRWMERLEPILSPNDQVLIIRIDASSQAGVLPSSIWSWIKERQGHE